MNRSLGRAASIALSIVLVVVVVAPARAQEGTSQLRGHVTDAQGGALPGVTVVVTNQDSGNYREAVSGVDGSWLMAALRPGRYEVSAQLQGFKKFVRRDLVVAVGNQLSVDVQLELG